MLTKLFNVQKCLKETRFKGFFIISGILLQHKTKNSRQLHEEFQELHSYICTRKHQHWNNPQQQVHVWLELTVMKS
jgi:hypothetical protein